MRWKTKYVKWLTCVVFLLGTASTAVDGMVIYVDADAAGAGTGSSWADAYWCLQDALASAQPGDEIRVANGIYKPDRHQVLASRAGNRITASGDRAATFALVNGVIHKGGYAGYGQPDPNARDTVMYETILSGDLNANDGSDFSNNEDNSRYGVVSSLSNDATTVLIGFTIVGGCGNSGAGLRCMESDLQISDCKFAQNEAEGDWGGGGAIISYFGSPVFRNCVIQGNQAWDSGGGAWIEGGESVFEGCLFKENVATTDGGGLYAFDANSVKLVDCVFIDNSSQRSGGGLWHAGGKLELIDSTFLGNSAVSSSSSSSGSGGAVYTVFGTESKVINCILNANRARDGGAIYGTVQSIENCRFTANTAEQGGALMGIQDAIIRNCVFAGNRADMGGAICTSSAGPSLIFCTLSDNSALNGSAIGMSPHFHAPRFLKMNISNCILRNDGEEIGALLDIFPDISIIYSDVRGGWPGQGNIDVDPDFARPGYWEPDQIAKDANDDIWVDGDYHLKSQAGRWDPISESWVSDDVTSPCIDTGDPNSPIAFEPFPNGALVNMGAYGATAFASKSPSGVHAKYGEGSGKPDDPYLIFTASQMNSIGTESNEWDKHFKLMAYVDLSR